MAWDALDLHASILDEFGSFADYYEGDDGVVRRVVDFGETPPTRPVGRPATILSARGQTRKIQDWAADLLCDTRVIFRRLANGWSVEDAVTKPVRSHGSRIKTPGQPDRIRVGNVEKTIAQWAEILGCATKVITHRLERGWFPALAVTTPVNVKPKRNRVRPIVAMANTKRAVNDNATQLGLAI